MPRICLIRQCWLLNNMIPIWLFFTFFGVAILPCYFTIISVVQSKNRAERQVEYWEQRYLAIIEQYKNLEIQQRIVVHQAPKADEEGYLESLR